MFETLVSQASHGILGVYETLWVFCIFLCFLMWISVNDLKTKTIKDYQNLFFLLMGLWILFVDWIGVSETTLSLGWGHLFGMMVGFLLLFIPGMILNYAYGGDIKFVTVLGFWVGGSAILLLMVVAVAIQIIFFILYTLIQREMNLSKSLPFAPAFALSYMFLLFYLI